VASGEGESKTALDGVRGVFVALCLLLLLLLVVGDLVYSGHCSLCYPISSATFRLDSGRLVLYMFLEASTNTRTTQRTNTALSGINEQDVTSLP